MSDSVVSIVASVLEKVVLGARDSEIAAMIDTMQKASATAQDIERLHRHLKAIAAVIRDRGISERGLNLLIDTTHDLSSTLALQDLLRTIVSRARNLVGAYRRKLSEREISILGSFALHAGVAMRNAHAFSRLSEALIEAERNRTALIDHMA